MSTEPDSIDRAMALEATFVDQEFLHSDTTKGDCFRACIATILRMPIKAVPHFAALDYAPDVFVAMECAIAWLNSRGYEMWMDIDDGENPLPLCIVTGFSPRGVAHACVGVTATGSIIHDPHPSRAGLSHIDKRLYLFRKQSINSLFRQLPIRKARDVDGGSDVLLVADIQGRFPETAVLPAQPPQQLGPEQRDGEQ